MFVLLIVSNSKVKSQGFEGQITYRFDIIGGNVDLPDTSINLLNDTPKGLTVYTIKNNNFKSVMSNLSDDTLYKTINLYNPKTKDIYYYTNEENGICMIANAKEKADKYKFTISRDINDTIFVMGEKCSLVSINYEKDTIELYYSEKYNVDTSVLIDDKYEILNYIYVCGAIPLKIKLKSSTMFYSIEYTAIKVDKKLIDDKIFVLPKDRQIVTFPIKVPNE